jgi:hypothetical protein
MNASKRAEKRLRSVRRGTCPIPVALTFLNSRFTGFDVDSISIARAREKAARASAFDRVFCWPREGAQFVPEPERDDFTVKHAQVRSLTRLNERGGEG